MSMFLVIVYHIFQLL